VIISVSPTFKPQTINAKDRFERNIDQHALSAWQKAILALQPSSSTLNWSASPIALRTSARVRFLSPPEKSKKLLLPVKINEHFWGERLRK
jgi:hypothetical protein